MSTLLEEPVTQRSTTPSERLRTTMAAARLSFTWLGVRKTLTSAQKHQAADAFGAEGKFLSAGKKLLDTAHPAFKAVTAIRGRAVTYWKGVSLPFPEPGIRLIRQETITPFDRQIAEFRAELADAVADLPQNQSLHSSVSPRRNRTLSSPARRCRPPRLYASPSKIR